MAAVSPRPIRSGSKAIYPLPAAIRLKIRSPLDALDGGVGDAERPVLKHDELRVAVVERGAVGVFRVGEQAAQRDGRAVGPGAGIGQFLDVCRVMHIKIRQIGRIHADCRHQRNGGEGGAVVGAGHHVLNRFVYVQRADDRRCRIIIFVGIQVRKGHGAAAQGGGWAGLETAGLAAGE